MRIATLALALLLSGCAQRSEPTMGRIVNVSCEPTMGFPDCTTVVEANGSRYARSGTWGEVGDTFVVVIVKTPVDSAYWEAPDHD